MSFRQKKSRSSPDPELEHRVAVLTKLLEGGFTAVLNGATCNLRDMVEAVTPVYIKMHYYHSSTKEIILDTGR